MMTFPERVWEPTGEIIAITPPCGRGTTRTINKYASRKATPEDRRRRERVARLLQPTGRI